MEQPTAQPVARPRSWAMIIFQLVLGLVFFNLGASLARLATDNRALIVGAGLLLAIVSSFAMLALARRLSARRKV